MPCLALDYSTRSWEVYLDEGVMASPGTKYLAALYWSCMTITTVGYGDLTPRNIYETWTASIIMFLVRACLRACVRRPCVCEATTRALDLAWVGELSSALDSAVLLGFRAAMVADARTVRHGLHRQVVPRRDTYLACCLALNRACRGRAFTPTSLARWCPPSARPTRRGKSRSGRASPSTTT